MKKPCKTCEKVRKVGQSVRGTVAKALGRKTMAEKVEESRDASVQRQPAPQRARPAGNALMSVGTPYGRVSVHGSHRAVDYVGQTLRNAEAAKNEAKPGP